VRFPRATRQVVITIAGKKHWLWRAVDQHEIVLDVLVQCRRNAKAAKRLLRKLLKKQPIAARVMIAKKGKLCGLREDGDAWCGAPAA
jgi:transposase-like protein